MKVIPDSWQVEPRSFVGRECNIYTPTGCMQRHGNEGVLQLARVTGLPLLLTLDSHFVDPSRKLIQDIGLDNSTGGTMRFSTSYHLLNTAEAWEGWKKLHGDSPLATSQFVQAVENNHRLVSLCEPVSMPRDFHLPLVDVPADIASSAPTEELGWERLLLRHIHSYNRLPPAGDARRPLYLARLAEELEVVARNGRVNFVPYFLAVHDMCRLARESDNPVGPGRGSAAGCLLSYLLQITHIDPIPYRLSFARFLSRGRIARGKFPDIDLDLGDPEKLASLLKEIHGDHFVRVSATGTLKPKSALKDVARALLDTKAHKEISDEVDAVTKSMPDVPQGVENLLGWLYGYEDNTGSFPGQVAENPLLADFLARHPDVKAALDSLLGLPRSLSRHASGFILADVAVGEMVPLCAVGRGDIKEVCTEFDKDVCEKLGLVKVDLLGLNTLKDIRGALDRIKERHGLALDIYELPVDDQDTFDSFCAGRNETVFQFNSAIATNLCHQVQPRSIDDLSQITANGRPGTMYATLEDGKTTLIDAWVARRQGKEPPSFIHPELTDILQNTMGIFVYQEQVTAAFQRCCDFSEERADEIREIVGKKKLDQMEKILPEIAERLRAHGWNERQIASFISLCVAASSYSFNASHSVAYAFLGYVCQYLKTHYPLEWWTSVLQNSKADDIEKNAQHCRNFLLMPDVNNSDLEFYIMDGVREKIVYPLSRVKGVKGAGETIVNYRPYTSFEDFMARVPYNKITSEEAELKTGISHKGVVSALIWSGAFDALAGIREPMERIGLFERYLHTRLKNKPLKDALAKLPRTEAQVLLLQNLSLPLNAADFAGLISKNMNVVINSPQDVQTLPENAKVCVAGYVQSLRLTKTKKTGEPMAKLTIVNQCQATEITVFPRLYALEKAGLEEGTILMVQGKTNDFNNTRGVVADSIDWLGQADLDDCERSPAELEKAQQKAAQAAAKNAEALEVGSAAESL